MGKGWASQESQAATVRSPGTAAREQVAPRAPAAGAPMFAAPTFAAKHAFAPNPFLRYNLVPRNWWLISPILAVLLGVALAALRSLPPLQTIELALVALIIPVGSGKFIKLERSEGRGGVERFAIMLSMVALPLLAFGCGLSVWVANSPLADWNKLMGVAVMAGISASILLTGRLPSLLAGQVGLWSGIALSDGSQASVTLLLLGFGTSVFLAFHYSRQQLAAAAHHREREHAQFRAEEFLAEYENSGQGWFWETDPDGRIAYVSAFIGEQVGKSASELLGRPFSELFILESAGPVSQCSLSFHLTARSSFQEMAVRAAVAGEERLWAINGRPVYDDHNAFLGFRGSGSDLTERRRSLHDTSRLAHYDSLTGLANRFQMSQSLEKILEAPQEGDRACAVLLLDLDRFKHVNDTLGHPAGDALLKVVAQRLTATVGKLGRVGRLGGDEFQVILPGRTSREELAELSHQIIASLSQPYRIEGTRVVIGASIGIALSIDDGVTSEAIIRNADLALYAAKDAGRGCHHFYAPDLHIDAEERRQLEQDLREAIAYGGLELYYQPVVATASETITGFEALLRWNHPVWGAMSPARFIPIAEDAGLIAPIGEWALRTACHDLAQWPDWVRVAVNVSALQFANPALAGIVTSALAAAGIAPARLELEITESVFLNDSEGAEAMSAALKRIGVRLTLDDFGTGYSSLGYLQQAPFDTIKIDQSFVRQAAIAGSRNGAIISSIISLAEALGMATTAEGIETLDELELVRLLGCSHVQGYIYERPLCFAAATELLSTGLEPVLPPASFSPSALTAA
jgi:diguanylate cyclase (GGDEF)-like protein/PAS domain S-box-containing protein